MMQDARSEQAVFVRDLSLNALFLTPMETTMRFMKAAAVIGTLVAGAFGLSGGASASPLAAGAMPAAKAGSGLVEKAQFYTERRIYRPRDTVRILPAPVYRPVRVVRPYPVYRPVRVVRPYPIYRPVRVVRSYPVYRPVRVVRAAPRQVCRTRVRIIRSAYGQYLRRSVRTCTSRL